MNQNKQHYGNILTLNKLELWVVVSNSNVMEVCLFHCYSHSAMALWNQWDLCGFWDKTIQQVHISLGTGSFVTCFDGWNRELRPTESPRSCLIGSINLFTFFLKGIRSASEHDSWRCWRNGYNSGNWWGNIWGNLQGLFLYIYLTLESKLS